MHADAQADREPAAGELLHDLEVDLVGLVAAAVLAGVGQAEQSGPSEGGEDVAGEDGVLLVLGRAWGDLLVHDLPGQLQELFGLGCVQRAFDRHEFSHCRAPWCASDPP